VILSRSLSLVEITGRTLEGVAYNYGLPSLVTDDGSEFYYEQILRDADHKSIRDRAASGGHFDLLVWHSQTTNKGQFPPDPIGEVEFRPTADALAYRAVLSRSRLADEMRELIADETARDVSVSYKPLRDIEGVHDGRQLVSRAQIALRELSVCPTGTGQHEGAKVLVMRSAAAPASRLDVEARLRLLHL
jgi:hypothetical protein